MSDTSERCVIDFRRRTPQLLALAVGCAALACGGDKLVLPQDTVPTAIAIIKGNNQAGTVGVQLADSLIVRVTDASGRPVESQPVTFTVVSGGGSVAPTTSTTNSDGRAGTRWTLGSGSGAQTVQAKVTGSGAPANLVTLFTATANASGASTIAAVSGNGQTGTAGSSLTDSIVVLVTDPASNPVAGVTVAFTATGGGTVSSPSVVTGADGRAAVKRTLGSTAGAQATVVTVAGLAGSPITFTATATVGAAGQLTVTRQPSALAQSGVAFAQQPQIQLRDVNGNPVSTAGIAVTATVSSGPSGATLNNATAVTNAAGLATFAGLALNAPAGSYTLNFTGTNVSGVTSTAILVGAGSATGLGITVPPSSTASSGVPFGTQPRIQLLDAAGNPVAQAGVTVVAAAIAGGTATLSGTTSVQTDASGLATFTNLTLSGAAGSQATINFSAGGLTSVNSGAITIGAGQVSAGNSTLVVTGSPITASSGSSAATVTVTARDASGNPVAGAAVSVSVTGTNAISPPSGVVTNSSGVATVTVSSTEAGVKTVTASINGVSITQQGTLTINPAAPSASQSTVAAAPSSIGAAGGTSSITVTVRDAFGNAISGATVVIAATGSNNSITQPPSTTTASGVAIGSFSSITAESKTISATAAKGGAPVAISQTATVVVGLGSADPGNSSVNLSSGSVTVGVGSVTVTVTARDAGNNTISGAAVSVSVTGSGNTITPASGTTNGSGVFTATISSLEAGVKTVTATVNGTTLTSQPTLTVNKATTSTSLSLSPATTSVGQTVTATFTVSPPGAGTPTGTVTVSGGGASCNASVATGSCTLTPTTAGASQTFTATYPGDGNFLGSSGNATRTVSATATTTTITSDSPDPSNVNTAVTVAYAVAPVAPGAGTPSGNVTVSDGTTSCIGTVAAGSCALTFTTTGSHPVTATYAGNGNYTGSASAAAPHTVQANGATVSVVGSPTSSVTGQTVSFTATVAGSSGTPTGTVQFQQDGANVGSAVTLSGGTATISFAPAPPAGPHTITANYSGDGTYGAGSGSLANYIVNKGATSVNILNDGPDPSVAGSAYTVSFAVFATAPSSGSPSGTVTVSDGSATCSGSAPSGSCLLTSTTTGTKTLTATYAGEANFATSSASTGHTVTAATAAVGVTSSANPSVIGQTVTLMATVTGSAGTPTGTVQFVIDGSSFGSPISLSAGSASTTVSTLTVGTHSVSATYGGNATYASGTSGSLSGGQVVNKGGTSVAVALTSGANPSMAGSALSFTATVSATAPALGNRTGTVQFLLDGSNIGTAQPLSGNAATFTTSAVPTGTHTITATYSGDASFNGSTSPGLSQTVTGATATVTVSGPGATVSGQSAAYSATVTGAAGTATGTVQFNVDGSPLGGPVTLSSGTATSPSTSSLAVGSHTVTAAYSGDATYATASGSLAGGQVVNKGGTSGAVALTSGANPSMAGSALTFTATVSATAPASGNRTGTVQFQVDGANAGTAQAVSGNAATFTTSAIPTGTHTITAVYSGDANFNGSTSPGLSQTVNGATSTVTVSGPATTVSGQAATYSATVTGAAGTATGTVQFNADGSPIGGPVALSAGSATSPSTTSLSVGSHVITAVYSGDPTYTGNTGTLSGGTTVSPGGTTTAVTQTAGSDPSSAGATVTFTATISATAPAGGSRTGTVQFQVDGVSAGGPVAVSGNAAQLTIAPTAAGSHTITAIYSGDVNFTGSTSPGLSHTVTAGAADAAQSTVVAAPSTFTAGTGSSTVTVTVKDASGNPVSGATVVLTAAPSTGTSFTPPATTNASGVTTSSFTSSTPATTYTISATANSVTITQTATASTN